jgi:putative ABC transport system ATP-binding protein
MMILDLVGQGSRRRSMLGTQDQPIDNHNLISLRDVVKTYETEAGGLTVLKDVSLQVREGELVGVVGPSGSGKSTLLNMITGIDRPTDGQVFVTGEAVHTLSENELARWRGRNVGVIFQFFQLLPTLTILENVMLPMDFCNVYAPNQRRQQAMRLLERVGVANQADKFPVALSGGEQQRVAIARALANDPPIVVADEPTGNLDSQTADDILTLFRQLTADGKTVVMVTHERDIAAWVADVVMLADGRIVSEANNAYAPQVGLDRDLDREAAYA